MKKLPHHIPKVASYFFILLFCYAAISKAVDFENFQVQIGQSPLLSAYAGFVSYAVIILELLIVVLLAIPKTNVMGLYSSTALMSAFTIYIYLILNYSDFVPCSCGGILEKMGWTEHLIFNIASVILGASAVFISDNNKRNGIKNTLIKVLISNGISCGIVLYLFMSSEHIIKEDNNFTRRFLMHPIVEQSSTILDNEYYYFAGLDNKNVYLGNRKFPQKIITLDSAMRIQAKTEISLVVGKYNYKKIETQVRDPYYYIYDGTVPVIMKGTLGNPIPEAISENDAFFSQLGVINDTSFALRTQSSITGQLLIATLKTGKTNSVILHPFFIEKQNDGVFDSDGRLLTDPGTSEIIYTYSYRNQFVVSDSNAKIKNRLNTIDTITKANIQSVKLAEGVYKMGKPPLNVNGISRVYRQLLFNHSYLKGQFESEKRWKTSRVIDVYRTDQKLYIGSLYLPDRGKISVSDFIINDHYMYVIAGKELTQYKLTQPLLKYYKKGGSRKP